HEPPTPRRSPLSLHDALPICADGAYWIDPQSGAFITSTFYMSQLPPWAADFNAAKHGEQYWDKDWTDAAGKVLRHVGRMGPNGADRKSTRLNSSHDSISYAVF